MDWLTTVLLPIINALGLPILAIGIVLLTIAYQKSSETYKLTSDHLREENDRLRKRLTEADTFYFSEVEKIKKTVEASINSVKELEARKVELLSNADDSPSENFIKEIDLINGAIKELRSLVHTSRRFELELRAAIIDTVGSFEGQVSDVSEMIDLIGDTKSRLMILKFIRSDQEYKEIESKIIDKERGFTMEEERSEDSKQLSPPDNIIKGE